MKKTILFGIFAGATTFAMAQRNVGTARMMEPVSFDQSRAIDTIYPSTLDFSDLAVYGVVGPPDGPGGYILGTNGYGDQAKAQQFLLDGPVGVSEILFWFGVKSAASGSSTSNIKARLYNLNGPGTTTSGPVTFAPGTVLAEVIINIADVDTGSTITFTAAQFPQNIAVGTEFAAGVDFSTLAAVDTVALVSTTDGNVEFGEFLWEKWDTGQWFTMPAAGWGGGSFDIDAAIFVVVDDEAIGIDENGSMNNIRMSFLNGNISQGTVLLGYDVVEAGRMTFLVHNSKGQLMLENSFGTQGVGSYNHSFSTEGWAAGSYYVTLKNNGRPVTKKMVVQ
ncbi:MAG: T9SS type A sorting domain-containing protein [Flavobacteriales bacterium]|nr:T9SS type A sorting domain-containing protein [Flavobacteriales bacterium]